MTCEMDRIAIARTYQTPAGPVSQRELKSFVDRAARSVERTGDRKTASAMRAIVRDGPMEHWPLAAALFPHSGLSIASGVRLLCSVEDTERLAARLGRVPTSRGNVTRPDAIGAFTDLCRQKVRETGDVAKAVSAAVREDPDLHRQYVEAVNARQSGNSSSAAPAPRTSDPIAQFDAALAEARKHCKSSQEAVAKVVAADPELHRAYLDAVNGQ